jgi:hypothetical protein
MYNALRKPFEQILENAGVQDVHSIEYRVKGRSNITQVIILKLVSLKISLKWEL